MFRKFATAAILDAQMGADAGFAKSAHRAVFNFTPRQGYLYVRSRAISSRCNDNFDMFPADEIEKSYLSFIGKPVFVNHHNDDHRRARGVIIDAALHRDVNPDGSPDTWVELLHEVDAMKFPKLAKAILAGEVNRTSMGCDVQFSKCSVCHNVATSPSNYCQHIPAKKGKRIFSMPGLDGRREGKLVFEICSGLSFFENSLLVEQPADPTAYFLGEVVSGGGLDHLHASVQKTASVKETPWTAPSSPSPMQRTASLRPNPTSNIWNLLREAAAAESANTAKEFPVPQSRTEFRTASIWEFIHQASVSGDDLFDSDFAPLRSHLQTQADLREKKVGEMTEEELAQHHKNIAEGRQWSADHPLHPDHIVSAWHNLSDAHKQVGMNWYPDAHAHASLVSHLTNTPLHTVAGLLAVYSPKQHWAANLHIATHVARTRVPLGGGGAASGGFMTSKNQRDAAQRMLDGTHYVDAISKSGHKTRNFAHLIDTGGDDHSVVVDRHAYSVGTGHRITDNAFTHAVMGKLSSIKGYKEAADTYRDAAHTISQHEGRLILPHQVQAATWLGQQQKNDVEERGDLAGMASSRTAKAAQRHFEKWKAYAGEHYPDHPELFTHAPGTGYSNGEAAPAKGRAKSASRHPFGKSAYGDTKAPDDVDTLRSENCTVCGNSTAFDGKQCQVCGYVAPPRPFGDPNTDVARANDIRKQIVDGDQADPNQNDEMGNQMGDPEELDEQGADAEVGMDGQLPMLNCNNCGTGVQPAAPASDGGEPPYPADGDACPVCKKGQLLSEGDEDSEEGADDNDDEEDPEEGGKPQVPGNGDKSNPDPDEDSDDSDDDEEEEDDAPPPSKKDKKS